MSEAESIDETGADSDNDDDEAPHAYNVIENAVEEIARNLARIKKAGKTMAAEGHVQGSRALLEISGTVLPILADIAKAAMELDDEAEEREKQVNRRFAIIEATMLTPEDASSHIASLGDLRAYIDNMIAATIARAAGEGRATGMTRDEEQSIAHFRGLADGIVRTQLYLERFVAFGQAVGPGDDDEDDDEEESDDDDEEEDSN